MLLQCRLDELLADVPAQQAQRDAGRKQKQRTYQQRHRQLAKKLPWREVVNQPPAVIADLFGQCHAARQPVAPHRVEAVIPMVRQCPPVGAVKLGWLTRTYGHSAAVEKRVDAAVPVIDHTQCRLGIDQQQQPLPRMGASLYRLRQRNAIVAHAQPVDRVYPQQAAATRLQHTQRWQLRKVDIPIRPDQPMCPHRVHQQQARLQCLQSMLHADGQHRLQAGLAAVTIEWQLPPAFFVRRLSVRMGCRYRIAHPPKQGFALFEVALGFVGGGARILQPRWEPGCHSCEQIGGACQDEQEDDENGQQANALRRKRQHFGASLALAITLQHRCSLERSGSGTHQTFPKVRPCIRASACCSPRDATESSWLHRAVGYGAGVLHHRAGAGGQPPSSHVTSATAAKFSGKHQGLAWCRLMSGCSWPTDDVAGRPSSAGCVLVRYPSPNATRRRSASRCGPSWSTRH